MRKFVSFIPVIGILLVFNLVDKVDNIEEIWPNGFYYYGSAVFQAVSFCLIFMLFK